MSIVSAFVLLAVVWFMSFLVILPLRLKTQGDVGEVVPGTHASAPENPNIKLKAKITSVVALVVWVILVGIIMSGVITVRDFDWMGVLDNGANPSTPIE